mmetsp:Transcript_19432/g.23646  ORF Transcript_19432/g.23646 Transcript_19432/m.23646 type:complete len:156 (-) Transcript_19432:542-1009(-)
MLLHKRERRFAGRVVVHAVNMSRQKFNQQKEYFDLTKGSIAKGSKSSCSDSNNNQSKRQYQRPSNYKHRKAKSSALSFSEKLAEIELSRMMANIPSKHTISGLRMPKPISPEQSNQKKPIRKVSSEPIWGRKIRPSTLATHNCPLRAICGCVLQQ